MPLTLEIRIMILVDDFPEKNKQTKRQMYLKNKTCQEKAYSEKQPCKMQQMQAENTVLCRTFFSFFLKPKSGCTLISVTYSVQTLLVS